MFSSYEISSDGRKGLVRLQGSDLREGVYLYKVQTNRGAVSGKILKQ